MTRKRDYYHILGVSQDADLSNIKKAYRRLALKYHPDKNPGNGQAEEKFKEAAEAYGILSDPERRSRYDRFGHSGVGGTPFTGFDTEIFADFSDILGDLFGLGDIFGSRRRRHTGVRSGSDLRTDLEIDFRDAMFGTEAQIRVPRLERCDRCRGQGVEKPSDVRECPRCHGRGQIVFQQGFFRLARTCEQCRGQGRVVLRPCPGCDGNGRIQRERTLTVRIPPGVDTGTRLRLEREGEAGESGGPSGDLYVVLRVRPHSFFERDGTDLHCRVPISFSQAALGAEVQVATLRGSERIRTPAGTQSGAVFRLRGQGVPQINGRGAGDLYVTVVVVTPSRLSKRQRGLLEHLAEASNEEASSPDKSLFEKVKDLFT